MPSVNFTHSHGVSIYITAPSLTLRPPLSRYWCDLTTPWLRYDRLQCRRSSTIHLTPTNPQSTLLLYSMFCATFLSIHHARRYLGRFEIRPLWQVQSFHFRHECIFLAETCCLMSLVLHDIGTYSEVGVKPTDIKSFPIAPSHTGSGCIQAPQGMVRKHIPPFTYK